jgi:hypothetical protein
LPTILKRKNSSINVSISETYRDYVIIYLPGVSGVALGASMVYVPRIGRKWAMVFSSALMTTSLFLFASVNTQAANIGLSTMEYFFRQYHALISIPIAPRYIYYVSQFFIAPRRRLAKI